MVKLFIQEVIRLINLLNELKIRNIDIEIKKLEKKSISIEIDNRGKVIFRVPVNIKVSELEKIIDKRFEWIINNVKKVKELNKNILERQFEEDEIFLYLGEEYRLKFDKISRIDENKKYIYTTENNRKESLEKLYKFLAKDYIIKRVEYYLDYFEEKPQSIKIKKQKTRWGSCSFKNNLNFNYKIIMARKQIVDYLVIHEMCHMKHKNHSTEFWNTVKEILPDYKSLKEELKAIGFKLDL